MPISPYSQNKALDSLLATSFISLHSKNPKGTGESEIFGESYGRVDASALLSLAENGEKVSSGDISFKNLPKTLITHIGIWDSADGGNFLWSIELSEERSVHGGDSFTIPATALQLGLS
jgi:hypothetical protein